MAPASSYQVGDLSRKVYFITGGTAGLGAQTILALSEHNPGHIYFTGRNKTAGKALIERVKSSQRDVRLTFLEADISSLASVRDLAGRFIALKPQRLDVLMNNAGVMATAPSLSADGYESQFATNHMGHALLIDSLLPLLRDTARRHGDARIINMSSVAHNLHPKNGIHFDTLKTTQEDLGTTAGASWARYGQSKLANMLYSDQLARENPDLSCVAVHPGIVQTNLVSSMSFMKRFTMALGTFGQKRSTPAEGAMNQTWAATAPKSSVKSGVYYVPVGVEGNREGKGKDQVLAKKLYDWTQVELTNFEKA